MAVNAITMLKKKNETPEAISLGFEKQINKLKTIKARYTKLVAEEETFYENLEHRLKHLAQA